MKWTITESDATRQDPSGVEGIISRMEQELRQDGPPIEGFRFLNSAMEMLRFTREIEDEVLSEPDGADLYVGFQTGQKIDGEARRYQRIVDAGVKVVGFGTDLPADNPTRLVDRWISLSFNTRALENQWFLVSSHPTPIAFVGWETSEEAFGVGRLSAPGKEFKGFVSSDSRIVDAMMAYLERLTLSEHRKKVPVRQLADEITFPVRKTLVLTDREANSGYGDLRSAAGELARIKSSQVVLYDLSAASTLALVSAYPEENREQWFRTLNKVELKYFGRGFLADQIEELEAMGLEAGAVLPERPGFAHLAEWVSREKIDLIMIPQEMVRPGLLSRLKGFSLSTLLENTDIPAIVYESDDALWLANSVGAVVTTFSIEPEAAPIESYVQAN
jgi:hypothetical protein